MARKTDRLAALPALLRERREALGLTLREVEGRSERLGETIPFTVISRVEKGLVDPGFRRMSLLLRIYGIPVQVAADMAELQLVAGDLPADPVADYEAAIQAWKAGDLRKGLAHLLALQRRGERHGMPRLERQKALIAFSVAAASLGKYKLARQIVDDVLLEPPEPSLLVHALTQAAVCWHRLGSGDVALALFARAEDCVGPDDHRERARVLHGRAATLVTLGRHAEGRKELERALEAYRAARDTYGESRAMGVLVRSLADAGEHDAALKSVRRAQVHATEHGIQRLRVMRSIDEGRILLALGEAAQAARVLNDALSDALKMQDGESQFHAHYRLWKTYEQLGDAERADLELRAAQYYVRFLDEESPEAVEVRGRDA